jgi:hypothetical protein
VVVNVDKCACSFYVGVLATVNECVFTVNEWIGTSPEKSDDQRSDKYRVTVILKEVGGIKGK